MSDILPFILLAIAIILYMLPTWIAHERKNPMTFEIGCLNLFFGWTVLMWALLFLWAALSQDKTEAPKEPDNPNNAPQIGA